MMRTLRVIDAEAYAAHGTKINKYDGSIYLFVDALRRSACLPYSQGHRCTTNAMDWAAAFGQTDIVRWLSENRTEGCTKDAMGEGQWVRVNG